MIFFRLKSQILYKFHEWNRNIYINYWIMTTGFLMKTGGLLLFYNACHHFFAVRIQHSCFGIIAHHLILVN